MTRLNLNNIDHVLAVLNQSDILTDFYEQLEETLGHVNTNLDCEVLLAELWHKNKALHDVIMIQVSDWIDNHNLHLT